MIASTENRPEIGPEPSAGEMRSIARQPILDRNSRVHGYELHFEANPASAASGGVVQQVRTLLDETVLFGVEKFTGGLPAFVTCSAEALVERWTTVLPPATTVLQIPSTLEVTNDLLTACHELKAAGFKLALVEVDSQPTAHPLSVLVDYIKMGLGGLRSAQRHAPRGQHPGACATYVGIGVETQEDFQNANAQGFTLFEGYYFCRPETIRTQKIPANRLCHLDILRRLQKSPLDLAGISPLVFRDAALTYRLLRLVNSPIYAIRHEIRSIESAIMVLGEDTFRRIATLAILSEFNAEQPPEILHMALIRGRFCELAAKLCGFEPGEQYLLGMLSLLPAMMRYPMEALAPELPLRDEIRQALRGADVRERCLLAWIECHERNDQTAWNQIAEAYGLNQQKLVQFYIDAVVWDAAR
jgi:c-di-GMP-related signal transduction protein